MPTDKILIVFLDGVGLGDDDAETNPFVKYKLPFLSRLLDGHLFIRDLIGYVNNNAALLGLNATLNVPGLPQSGTGQTAILTGQNAPQHLGGHYGPYPNRQLKDMLAQNSLFLRLLRNKQAVAFANAYPDRFLERIKRGKGRLSANTRAALLAGLKIRGPEDLLAGRAVSAFLTNQCWRSWGYEMPLLTPEEAGAQFVSLGNDHALTYFELWYSDVIGHKQDMTQAGELLSLLDGFLAGIVNTMDITNTLLLVISDHGNFEDLSTKKHTLNPTFTLAVGAGCRQAKDSLQSLTDITPFVLQLLH